MASTTINFGVSKVIVTYDLSNNDISAQEIANASNGMFCTSIVMKNHTKYHLPNTTLETSQIFTAEGAANAFRKAFLEAKRNKPFSRCIISRIFCCEISGKRGYIENN